MARSKDETYSFTGDVDGEMKTVELRYPRKAKTRVFEKASRLGAAGDEVGSNLVLLKASVVNPDDYEVIRDFSTDDHNELVTEWMSYWD